MQRALVVTADDYALTRSVTDSILETHDRGSLTRVSILPNGLDFEHGMKEWSVRPHLELSIHLNLTEGRSLCAATEIPLLVDERGTFRRTAIRLFLTTFLATPKRKSAMRGQIDREVRAQVDRVLSSAGGRAVYIDGHQHVHMVPLVFECVARIATEKGLAGVRLPTEPLFVTGALFRFPIFGLIRHGGLNMLARAHRPALCASGVSYSSAFIGTLFSGELSLSIVRSALSYCVRVGDGPVEIALHPGVAREDELSGWTGDTAWHLSPSRKSEHDLLLDESFRNLNLIYGSAWLQKALRFIVVGTAVSIFHISLLYVLTEYAGIWYLYSTFIAWTMAFTASFTLQRMWTFGNRELRQTGEHLISYLGLQTINAGANVGLMFVLVDLIGVWYVAAQVVVAAIIATWTFLVSHFFIFSPPRA